MGDEGYNRAGNLSYDDNNKDHGEDGSKKSKGVNFKGEDPAVLQ